MDERGVQSVQGRCREVAGAAPHVAQHPIAKTDTSCERSEFDASGSTVRSDYDDDGSTMSGTNDTLQNRNQ